MTPISPAEMLSIQASANALLSLPCVIQRKAAVSDNMGQDTETYATVSSPGLLVGMRIPGAAELASFDYLIGAKNAWQIHFPIWQDVRLQDHLLISGLTLVVQVLLEPHSYAAFRDVLAEVIR